MKRIAMTALLKNDPSAISKYEEYHSKVWPEVIEGSRKCGIRSTFIYRFNRQLFMFMETVDDFDVNRDLAKYMSSPRAQEWNSIMTGFLDIVPGSENNAAWVPMKEICSV